MIFFSTSTSSSSLVKSSTSESLSIATPSAASSSSSFSVAVSTSASRQNITCQGVLKNYRKYTTQQHLGSFHVNAAIDCDSKYNTGLFVVDANFFQMVYWHKWIQTQWKHFSLKIFP